MARPSLSQRVTRFTTLGFALFWAVAVVLMGAVAWGEQEELFDQQLIETAHVLLPLMSQAELGGLDPRALGAQAPVYGLDEALIFRLLDADGRVLRASAQAAEAALPPAPATAVQQAATVQQAGGYRFYVTPPNAAGHALQLAAPMEERREAFMEELTSFILPMIALLPLTYLLVGWVARRALAPLRDLQREISARDGRRLDAIAPGDWPEDLVQIVGTLNGFMARLSQALDGERAFATNAAHELRTPVAIALAQTQQLRAEVSAPGQILRIEALERALQRMRRLVTRLLQLARAEAGVGLSAQSHDLAALTRLVLEDLLRGREGGRLTLHLPDGPVPAPIDPDAFAIVLANLVDNALQHGPAGGPVRIELRADGRLEVGNGGPLVPPAALAGLTGRFVRREAGGFGLGLHICQQILAQSGGRLELISPRPGMADGVLARATMPPAPADRGESLQNPDDDALSPPRSGINSAPG